MVMSFPVEIEKESLFLCVNNKFKFAYQAWGSVGHAKWDDREDARYKDNMLY